MTITLFNPNMSSQGYSADLFVQAVDAMGASMALVRNETKLVTLCKERGLTVIFRAAGDDSKDSPFGQNPAAFVDARIDAAPDADIIHLTNEVGLPAELDDWTRAAARRAHDRGKKVLAINAETNQTVEQWQARRALMDDLTAAGDFVGIHIYPFSLDVNEQSLDDAGYAPLEWLRSIGANVMVSEWAYIVDVTQPLLGYRGVMPPAELMVWLDQHAARAAQYGCPLFYFTVEQWPDNEQGEKEGFGTLDHPEIYQHLYVLNQQYPIGGQAPVAAIYDMEKYLCPTNGRPFVLGGLGSENCQSILRDDGWRDFMKNALRETFFSDSQVVGRGEDTSSLWTPNENPNNHYNGTYYIQYTLLADGTLQYGAAWAKRQMQVGEVFRRDCTVIVRTWDGTQIQRDDHIRSDLTVVAHHASKTFPSGIVVQDILELQWGGEERYFYANGCGLVGWVNLATGVESFIVSNSATIQAPAPIPTPRPNRAGDIPVPPLPVYPDPETLGEPVAGSCDWVRSSSANIRQHPDVNSADLGDLRLNDAVTFRPILTPSTPDAEGHQWRCISIGTLTDGYVATDAATVKENAPEPGLKPLGAYVVSRIPDSYVNVRAAPSSSGTDLGDLYVNDLVTLFDPPSNGWVYIEKSALKGWVSLQGGAVVFTPANPPAPAWTINLAVPYVSQIDSDSKLSNNDCGISSELMAERWIFKQMARPVPGIPSVDDLERKSPLAIPPPNTPHGLSYTDLSKLALATGFGSALFMPINEAVIKEQLDHGKPVVALCWYPDYNPAAGESFNHWTTIIGYSDVEFNTHDPYKGGANFRVLIRQMMKAMQNVQDATPFQGFVVT